MTRCIESVSRPYEFRPGQCANKAKPGSQYCGVHSPEKKAEREAKAQADFDKQQARWQARYRAYALASVVDEILGPETTPEQLREALTERETVEEPDNDLSMYCVHGVIGGASGGCEKPHARQAKQQGVSDE